MRLTVIAGKQKLLIPVHNTDHTIGWLATEIGRRLSKFSTNSDEPVYSIDVSGPTKNNELLKGTTVQPNTELHTEPVAVPVKELRTSSNHRLDMHDQIYDILHDNDTIVAITGSVLSDDVRSGDMVNQYYINEQIGEGTFGRVFKAKDLNLNRMVAIKVLKKDKATEVSTRRFLREAELNGRLSFSPHIVTVYDFGRTATGILYIVMELLKGRPLGDLIDERIENKIKFDVLDCIHIMSPVLRGLQAAHSHNPPVIHRDLKPDNIWLNEHAMSAEDSENDEKTNDNTESQHVDDSSSDPLDYASKIMDFGIAIPSELWHDTLACGTRMYSSPEQVRRKYKLDGRSDIYSVGVILYQMLSLLEDVPFDPIDINLGQQIPHISEYTVTPITEHMAHIVMTALQKNPDDRWTTAEQMADELHKEEAALLSSNPPHTIQPKKHICTQNTDNVSESKQWDRSPEPAPVPDDKSTVTKTVKQTEVTSEATPIEPVTAPSFRDQDLGSGIKCGCIEDCKCKCIHCCCNKQRNRQRHYQRMLQRRPSQNKTVQPNNQAGQPSYNNVTVNKTVAISQL